MSTTPMPITGRLHQIVLSETEAPRVFEVRCTACHTTEPHERCTAACHRVTWTPWGEDHAAEVGALHLFYMGHPEAKRLHHQPEAAMGRYR